MNQQCAQRLPCLVCPLIVNPDRGLGRDEEPIHKPGFPGVNLRWDGFYLPALRLISMHTNLFSSERHAMLTVLHEGYHKDLGNTPFSVLKKTKLYQLYVTIFEIFSGKEEQIQVPLTADKSGNDLQKEWAILERICRESKLIEEVYAVRSSFVTALEDGIIRPRQLPPLISTYKIGYEEEIPGYTAAYEALGFLAGKLGETAASALMHSTLVTANPRLAFYNILLDFCGFYPNAPHDLVWHPPKEVTDYLAEVSFDEAHNFFTGYLLEDDSDDLYYGIKRLSDAVEKIEQDMRIMTQGFDENNNKNTLFDLLWGSPPTVFFTAHNASGINFHLIRKDHTNPDKVFKRIGDGDIAILLEAILQQLLHGHGLLCPFWEPHACCSEVNRELLENVWDCTISTPSCLRWERLGCLRQRSRGTLNDNTWATG